MAPSTSFLLKRIQASRAEILILKRWLSKGKNSLFIIKQSMCGTGLSAGTSQIEILHTFMEWTGFRGKGHRNRLKRHNCPFHLQTGFYPFQKRTTTFSCQKNLIGGEEKEGKSRRRCTSQKKREMGVMCINVFVRGKEGQKRERLCTHTHTHEALLLLH